MDSAPSPNEAPERASDLARQRPRLSPSNVSHGRATAYTPKPDFAADATAGGVRPARNRWMPWAAGAVAVALLFGGGIALHRHAAPGVLVLEAADIDQAATANAREMLARGEIPPSLAHASDETRREVADGRQSLYSKQLLPPEPPAGLAIHVTVSEAGTVLGEDILTSEHPRTTTFPAGPGMPAHFHFVVESPGPEGTVTCWASSENGVSVHTPPMPKDGTGDLEAVAR